MQNNISERLGHLALDLHEKGKHSTARELEIFAEELEGVCDDAHSRLGQMMFMDDDLILMMSVARRMYAENGGPAQDVYDA